MDAMDTSWAMMVINSLTSYNNYDYFLVRNKKWAEKYSQYCKRDMSSLIC